MAKSLVNLGYISKSIDLMNEKDLVTLLNTARRNNDKNQITGMLLYSDGAFLQILEGPLHKIEQTFTNIQEDSRHKNIKVLFDSDITERSFPHWTMGFRRLNPHEIKQAPGMNYFLEGEEPLDKFLNSQTNASELLKNILLFFRRTA